MILNLIRCRTASIMMAPHRVNESNILLTCFGDKLPIRWLRDMN